jgi:EAL domain-containing protein (putative c-di-GMP-specific phosphodiesterase class I)
MTPAQLDLWLHLEPIVRLVDHRIVAQELLLRPLHGPRLDQRADGDAGLDLAQVTDAALTAAGEVLEAARLPLHVNITPADLARPDLVDLAVGRVGRDLLPWLVLEVTERSPLVACAVVEANLALLRRLGVRFAVDDFGDGWAGPASVAILRPEIIKVRLARVAGVRCQRGAARLRRLAAAHRAEVVVEQIESGDHLLLARRSGFGHGQGWFWSGARQRPTA